MIYEIRTYRLKTGALGEYIKIVTEVGIKIQQPHLGNLVGYYYSEIGVLNEIVHIWAYQDLNDRELRRTKLAQDPAWQAFLPKLQPLIDVMENKVMKPFPFITAGPSQGGN